MSLNFTLNTKILKFLLKKIQILEFQNTTDKNECYLYFSKFISFF